MTKQELETIRNVIERLQAGRDGGKVKCSPEIQAALTDKRVAIYLDTWVIGALECLLPESRDPKLAVSLSR